MIDVVLTGEAANFVAGGGRDVDLGKLALPAPLAAGAQVRCVDDRGNELAIGLADPENDKLRVFATVV